ncbi:hypothetical protein [Leptospira borgpetersenii]|uniref:hypothetical protein n=1 Tax=Leptospira borgpetersenii TaxID=174 RepID=UPI0003453C19|nr:hypothetical protein B1H38_15585 [Leptospira borgpetersenii serovar Ballum]QHE27398.1 hypothetical protein GS524_10745 [Leptospira borgpetersenii]QHE30700.1 hypothetical protein GS523_10755 [Leptospira borgpetersenii]QHE34003.1 hypothetical protein GS517_10745 [Leptospira borgpetersenii]QHE37236.1 hypothetical protein GS510_10390 [Leptospira borgpetersenii]
MKRITICFSRTIERKNFLNLKNSYTFLKVNSFFDKTKVTCCINRLHIFVLLRTDIAPNAEKLNFENHGPHSLSILQTRYFILHTDKISTESSDC